MENQMKQNHLTIKNRIDTARKAVDPDVIRSFLFDVEQDVRVAAASNLKATEEVVAEYARDDSPYVRAAAADNDNIGQDYLMILAADEFVIVREAAVANIRRRMRQGRI